MTNAEGSQYLTPGQVAVVFHVSPKTVTRWAVNGLLPCVVTLGGHRRFHRDDVQQVLSRLAGEETSPSARP